MQKPVGYDGGYKCQNTACRETRSDLDAKRTESDRWNLVVLASTQRLGNKVCCGPSHSEVENVGVPADQNRDE